MLSLAAPLLLLMQVGPNPATGPASGVEEALRDRPQREQPAEAPVPAPERSRLAECLVATNQGPDAALDVAQAWRESAADQLELAQSAHCLGLALVRLERFAEARDIFGLARDEAPADNPAYRARLAAMAGHAALAGGDAAAALPLIDSALALAATSANAPLQAGIEIDRARVLVALGRPDEAAAALAQARVTDASNAQAWLLSATLARRTERLAEAQQFIEQAAVLAPREAAVGLEAGVIAALAGRDEDARRSFASVLEVAPNSAEAASATAYLGQLGVAAAPPR